MASITFSVITDIFGESFGVQFLLIIITTLAALYIFWKRFETQNLPPVPWNLPLVGSVPWILLSIYRSGLPVYEFMRRLKYTYGNVYAFNCFGKLVVVINDYQSIQKAFNNPHLNDRPGLIEKDAKIRPHQGLVLGSGKVWSQQRRFTQTAFRSFGVGRNTFDEKIATECRELVNEIIKMKGEAFNPNHILVNAVSNVICSVVFGNRFNYSDDRFQHLLNLTMRQVELGNKTFHHMFLPFLSYFPSKGLEEMFDNVNQLTSFVDVIIREHKLDFNPEYHRDYMDVYINELRENKEEGSKRFSELTEENMRYTISQLFTAGTESTALSLQWGLLYMVYTPDVQERVQREIDEIVGRERLPMISDKPSLPYTQATILEIQRIASVARLGVPHACSQTTSLCGYTIPKGAIVVSNIWAVDRDPEVWPDPQVFKPERFLDENGELIQREELIPFCTGRRTCLGDNLARMELFIFFTHLLHQLTFAESPSFVNLSGLDQGRNPEHFKLRAIKRE